MPSADPAQVAAVRRFNRFYTRQIGLLRKSYLGSPYSLTEARVLYELAQHKDVTAVELAHNLDFDAGYLSRVLARFEKRGLVSRTPSLYDRRQAHLALTAKGRKAFAPLDGRSAGQTAAMLDPLRREDRPRLIEAMRTIETLLTPEAPAPAPFTLRAHQPGDIGWIIHRHGVLYAQECGWGLEFEALVAQLGAKIHHAPRSQRDHRHVVRYIGAHHARDIQLRSGYPQRRVGNGELLRMGDREDVLIAFVHHFGRRRRPRRRVGLRFGPAARQNPGHCYRHGGTTRQQKWVFHWMISRPTAIFN